MTDRGGNSLWLDAYWLREHSCKLDWSDPAAVSARFDRAEKGEGRS